MLLGTLLLALAPTDAALATTAPALAREDPAPAQAADITVVQPKSWQVVQRDDRGGADVRLIVQVPRSPGRVTASARPLAGGPVVASASLALAAGEQPVLTGTMRVPQGGWYRISLQADRPEGPVEIAQVERLGVGEVFVIAGQSNSTNYGEERFPALDERVSAFDGETWRAAADPLPGVQDGSSNGSPWPVCGQALVAALDVPVGFVSCGYGGTTIAQWQRGVRLNPESKRSLYEGLRLRVARTGAFRAILWHQGESDAHAGTTQAQYVERFRALKDALEADTGFAGPWIVARASYVPGEEQAKMDAVRAAQAELWQEKVALEGPDTDDLLGAMRHSKDGIHFSKAGLEAHGKRWAERIQALFFAD